jgi:hypothetical protein
VCAVGVCTCVAGLGTNKLFHSVTLTHSVGLFEFGASKVGFADFRCSVCSHGILMIITYKKPANEPANLNISTVLETELQVTLRIVSGFHASDRKC